MKQLEQESIHLTSECLRHFWQGDCGFVLERCAEDVTWVGAQQEQFRIGLADMEADLRAVTREMQPCHLVSAEFFPAACDRRFCTVVGRYLVTTDQEAAYFLQAQQRCTMVWEKREEGLRLKHVHISNPMNELQVVEQEQFPNLVGKMAHQYLLHHIRKAGETVTLAALGAGGSLHFVRLTDILYIAAKGKFAVIHTSYRDIAVKSSIAELAEQAGNALVAVHRSFLVNPDYMVSLVRYKLTLLDGTQLPIPVKKFNDLRAMLLSRHQLDET